MMNKLLLIGNLKENPLIRFLPSGKQRASFSIAADRRYRTADGEKHTETEWFKVVAYGRLAVCSEGLIKGKSVFIEGRIRTRPRVNSKGMKRYTTTVVAEAMVIIGNKSQVQEERMEELGSLEQ